MSFNVVANINILFLLPSECSEDYSVPLIMITISPFITAVS